jgi:hypothetical protein
MIRGVKGKVTLKIPMKGTSKAYKITTGAGLLLLAFTIACRHSPPLADFYAGKLYPCLSAILSWVSSPFPFSLQDLTIVILVAGALVALVVAVVRRRGWKRILRGGLTFLLWMYVWVYMGWCVNYSRSGLLTRIGSVPAVFEKEAFETFLIQFTEELNASWTDSPAAGSRETEAGIKALCRETEAGMKAFYKRVPDIYGLATPRPWQHPKPMMFNALYSSIGVQGYIGPLFSESHLNKDLLPMEYPFTFAHEYAHLLGVSNEAEANWWAFQACRASADPAVRYSGYARILVHVWINAAGVLPEEEFGAWRDALRPEVLADLGMCQAHWNALRFPVIDRIHSRIYDLFLKGNQIPSGIKNYSEVVLLLLSLDNLDEED